MVRYFRYEYENGKYKQIFERIEPIIKNAISHHTFEYYEFEDTITFLDEEKNENLKIRFVEFVLKFVSDIQLMCFLSTVQVSIIFMIEKKE
ncbi:MAG: hypothetical protein KAU62_05390 [Candidatus Heimdallarchaeota archaeon]|nr:hypothetical protein [Candidatus Heimdallarchaeota archaeon]MCK4610574.1 hypothetical protein [Candidatus Heimdallarchaeota archaeon]